MGPVRCGQRSAEMRKVVRSSDESGEAFLFLGEMGRRVGPC